MTNTTTKPTESFADLFAESLAKQEMKQGEVIPAEVVRVDYNYVVVNAGLLSKASKTDMATKSCPAIRPSAWLPG